MTKIPSSINSPQFKGEPPLSEGNVLPTVAPIPLNSLWNFDLSPMVVNNGGENCNLVVLKEPGIDFREPFNLNTKKNTQSEKESF